MTYKLSVVVPIYNVGKYIERGLKSLISQRVFRDMEIILVDDGSTDDSIGKIERYLDDYCNIKLVRKRNGGVSSARNKGLEIATGKYVCFFDPDDVVDDDYYESLINLIDEKSQIGVCNLMDIMGNKEVIKKLYRRINIIRKTK